MAIYQACLMVAMMTTLTLATFTPVCDSEGQYIRDPVDCRKFYLCSNGTPYQFTCGPGTVFNPDANVCDFPANIPSEYQCNEAVPSRCEGNQSLILPDTVGCQLYYNCSDDTEPGMYSFFSKYQKECPYPQLFNIDTGACDSYANVDCGDRNEPNAPCEYLSTRCPVAHCIPCEASVGSADCTGLPDGNNVHSNRPDSPFYAQCQDERTVGWGQCPGGQIFSATTRQCEDITS